MVVSSVQVTIDILKMDIEYSEWDALEVMLTNVSCLANVKQLMIEFHTHEKGTNATKSRDDLTRYWRVLRGIYHLGFKLWNVWNNPHCNFRSQRIPKMTYCGCFNMYFLNVKYLGWNCIRVFDNMYLFVNLWLFWICVCVHSLFVC